MAAGPEPMAGGGSTGCRRSAGILFLVLLLASPAAAELTLFFPSSSGTIPSTGVLDMAEGKNGEIYFATDSGLSVYRDGWTTLRITTPLENGSLLSDHVLAVETDHRGFAWVGYPSGLQILSGSHIITLRDQQSLKNLNINALYRDGEDMWVATGSAGVHRWRNGTWRWFSPWGKEGLGAYDIRSLAEDPEIGTLYLASADNGLWVANPDPDSPAFSRLLPPAAGDTAWYRLQADPFGGVYLFNRSTVLHHSFREGFRPVPWMPALRTEYTTIYDMTVARSGACWLATDTGIYGFSEDGKAVRLEARDGIGPNAVKHIFADRSGRIWFVTQDRVGYVPAVDTEGTPIPVQIHDAVIPPTSTPVPTPLPTTPRPLITPMISVDIEPVPEPAPSGPLQAILADLTGFLDGLLGRG